MEWLVVEKKCAEVFSVDPLLKKYPELTPYQFASNTPIQAVDLDGAESLYGWSIGLTPHQSNDIAMGWAKTQSKVVNGTASGIKKSVVKTWNFITSDAWKASTWKNIGSFIQEATLDMSTVKIAPSPLLDVMAKDIKDNLFNGDAYTRSEYFAEIGTDALLAKGIGKAFTVTEGMVLAEKIAARTNLATSFYESVGGSLKELSGIDFKCAVQTITLKKGSIIQQ